MNDDSMFDLAMKNGWQCFRNFEFTWLAGDNCPDYGSSDCPMTMRSDRQCRMNDEREAELLRYRQVKQ